APAQNFQTPIQAEIIDAAPTQDTQQLGTSRKSGCHSHVDPQSAILALCSSRDSHSSLPAPGNFTQPLKSADSHGLKATERFSKLIIQ
ncbi:Hypothetical predicted protein, partial [Marmota monax]